ncbi:hypothetical protein ACFX1X_030657 [Malus domestica]|uniref:Uncharacterized protein n=1 Tax=Malus domestica TaxID=3750 RepID=A0A498KAF2_MALDO|nr:hypothetical protein DVH24_003986 [Malus domestica]
MCNYGGKIQPCPHNHQFTYVGGDTKILVVDRNIKLSAIIFKLSSICDTPNDADGSSPTVPITASPTNPDFLGIAILKNR